ncbi:MAG: hypothetical protein H7Y36_07520 [Armatimonadetes bacterium]|nr:hypothetical protein [Akkermansiaceae bacterium]
MTIRNFIGVSSALLLAWLGATFFHKVPAENYPKLGSSLVPASSNTLPDIQEITAKIEVSDSAGN